MKNDVLKIRLIIAVLTVTKRLILVKENDILYNQNIRSLQKGIIFMEKKSRGNFTSNLGFILAAAGSAVGLGNLWRFPYLAAKNGGGLFLFVYIILAVTFGFALMTTEIAIGRKTGVGPLLAYGKMNKKFGFWAGYQRPSR